MANLNHRNKAQKYTSVNMTVYILIFKLIFSSLELLKYVSIMGLLVIYKTEIDLSAANQTMKFTFIGPSFMPIRSRSVGFLLL